MPDGVVKILALPVDFSFIFFCGYAIKNPFVSHNSHILKTQICKGLVAFGHLGGPFGPSECCFVIRMGIFGGVSFLIFCDLKLISGFWILWGHFWVWFLSFENFESGFWISGNIWAESVFWHFVIWRFFRFFYFKGSFLSLIFEFWKMW